MLVLLLALWPKSAPQLAPSDVVTMPHPVAQISSTMTRDSIATKVESVSAAIEQVVQMASSLVELDPVAPVTTTVLREVTVTERIPAATVVEGPARLEPCEDVRSNESDAPSASAYQHTFQDRMAPIPTPPAAIRDSDITRE